MNSSMPSVFEGQAPGASLTYRPEGLAGRIRRRVRDWWAGRMSGTSRGATLRALRWGGGMLGVGLAVGLFFAFRPVPQPDYLNDPLDEVFNYTMLTDEFNRLPVAKRLELLSKLVSRLKGMSASDSVLLAAFAAGVEKSAREQIEKNISLLGVDLWDSYASQYDRVPPEEREQFLEQSFVDFAKTMETLAGESRDISDSERINEMREQVKRDRQFAKENPDRMPSGEALGRVFEFMNNDVGSRANPQQRSRGQQMMRDMSRHFRGQDISTGLPK